MIFMFVLLRFARSAVRAYEGAVKEAFAVDANELNDLNAASQQRRTELGSLGPCAYSARPHCM
ncbi:hypothetical protein [Pseudomonas sp. CGJS7]|uniref:hypothetical protein n=1 Tax=Pseudomonas sp. CGJS7 TaxID=3109348 RepID=UPI003008EB5C